MLNYPLQIEWLHQIQIAIPLALKPFFINLKYLDSLFFELFILPLFWFIYHPKVGFKLFCLFAFSGLLNFIMKQFYAMPRPSDLDPTLGMVSVGTYGLPSGGAQIAMVFTLFLFEHFKSWAVRGLALVYFALLSFSRLYLGVHFFTDVLMGWYAGILIYLVNSFLYKRLVPNLFPMQTSRQWGLLVLLFSAIFSLWLSLNTLYLATLAFGVLTGAAYFKIPHFESISKRLLLGLLTAILWVVADFYIFKAVVHSHSLLLKFSLEFFVGALGFAIARVISRFLNRSHA